MYKVTEKDLIGSIEGFPIEVVQKMVERQLEQYGECNISVFQDFRSALMGFNWETSREGWDFWDQVIGHRNFDLFFDRYPKQEELPLPRMVLVWDEDEDDAQERELLHVFPESSGLNYRYVVRGLYDTRDIVAFRNVKEIPTAKKMTKAEIEKELGYKIEIICKEQ